MPVNEIAMQKVWRHLFCALGRDDETDVLYSAMLQEPHTVYIPCFSVSLSLWSSLVAIQEAIGYELRNRRKVPMLRL
jgi:hypothetical protein